MGFGVSGISYELNGNILALQRKGNDELFNPNTTIDQLANTYAEGNQLSKVSDTSGKATGFKDGADQTAEYLYDENGNMTVDLNKGISSIEYNILNLPSKVSFSETKYIEYTYDASGTKYSKKAVDGEEVKVTDYLSGIVFENDKAQFMHHDEGRRVVRRNEEGVYVGFRYNYDMKDHLGDVRFTFHTNWVAPEEYLATLENDGETAEYEETYFSKYGEITRINADLFDYTEAGTDKTFSMRLNGAGNEVYYGLAKWCICVKSAKSSTNKIPKFRSLASVL